MIEESYFVAYDGGGNVVRLLNSSDGDVSAQYEYGPYGEPIREDGSMAQENLIRFRTIYFERETHCFYTTQSMAALLFQERFSKSILQVADGSEAVSSIIISHPF